MKKKLSIGLLFAVLFVAIASAIYYHAQYRLLKRNQSQGTSAQAQSVLGKVGRLIQLPEKETPSIARVADKTKLAHEAFFDKARNGDWLIIYTTAGEAILYRESENKIIAAGPVAESTPNAAATSTQ